jgi:hypothetical protein
LSLYSSKPESVKHASKKFCVDRKVITDFFTGFALERLKGYQDSELNNLKFYLMEYFKGDKGYRKYILKHRSWQVKRVLEDALKIAIKHIVLNFKENILDAIKE